MLNEKATKETYEKPTLGVGDESHKLLYKKETTEVYKNGEYRQQCENNVGVSGDMWEYEDIVSVQFNQLKGKLLNLIDMSPIEEPFQREAMKGLIKDFCNEKYKNIIEDMDGWVERIGFKKEATDIQNMPVVDLDAKEPTITYKLV